MFKAAAAVQRPKHTIARRPDSPLVHPGARTHGEIRGRDGPANFRHGGPTLIPSNVYGQHTTTFDNDNDDDDADAHYIVLF